MGSRSRVMLAALIGMVCIVTQTYGAATVSVRIVEQSSLGTTFEVVVPEMDTTTVMVDTMPFVVLTVEGANQVIATIDVADYPVVLSWNSVNNRVYCTSGESDRIAVIDGVGDTLIRSVRVRGFPMRMAYNALMNKLYVLCIDDNMVRVYDGSADTLIAEVWFESNTPYSLLWHPGSNRVFCTTNCDAEDTVFVIDCFSDQVAHRLPVGQDQCVSVWNPANNLVYTTASREVYALSAGGDSVVAAIPGCGYALWSACHVPFPNKLYVGDINHEGVALIDCNTQSVYDTILGGQQVHDILCDTLHGRVYVVGSWDVYVYDARTDTFIKSIHAGNGWEVLAWNSTNSRVYVADDAANAVYVIRDTSVGIGESGLVILCPRRATARIVTGTLSWTGGTPAELMDLCGRVVAVLRPGSNDLSRLSPGVYVTREEGSREHTRVVKLR
jgi:DNA-binding beta-propeller fold protein YncE